ncbi:MAG: LysR family transcriptional regulator [Chloroflexi bacterium]|uniref:LysR family transcriptional regulator n=1 Tax=Candidatus Chlorohelix allophototropha TaxID=3003348 RepID=A0A8T7LU61_9CHLR|nr:LysR family transcriptional regulator [Chloroflexota bacterium]WJW66305.1 LysR family transcriptional regulator [Chloroflexota bacterium L227-S17]
MERVNYPTLHQLFIFITVVEQRSFSKAADVLYLSQPSVSMQVQKLEDTLRGVSLFEQTGRKFSLTDAGEELYRYARQILNQMDEAMLVIEELQGMERGRLRIAADTTAGVYIVPAILGEFKRRYPQIKISLQVVNRSSVQDQLFSHQADLAVMGHTLETPELTALHLRSNKLVVIADPEHRLAGRKDIPVEELSKETFIVRESGSGTRASTEKIFSQHGVGMQIVMELSNNGAIKQAVAAGIGVAVISSATLELELASGKLVTLDVQGFPVERQWYLVHLERKRLSPPSRAFLELALSMRG